MNQSELMLKIIGVFESLNIPYMITGSHASCYYGEPRFTKDIDIVTDLKECKIKEFSAFFPKDEFYCDEEMIINEVKTKGQFNIIHPSSGLKIDIIMLKPTIFSREEFARKKRQVVFSGVKADIASPEDIIIKKMEFYKMGESEKHLRDITGILKISGKKIDLNYISKWAEDLNLTEIWEAVQKRVKEK